MQLLRNRILMYKLWWGLFNWNLAGRMHWTRSLYLAIDLSTSACETLDWQDVVFHVVPVHIKSGRCLLLLSDCGIFGADAPWTVFLKVFDGPVLKTIACVVSSVFVIEFMNWIPSDIFFGAFSRIAAAVCRSGKVAWLFGEPGANNSFPALLVGPCSYFYFSNVSRLAASRRRMWPQPFPE